jgi:hypothetical protein
MSGQDDNPLDEEPEEIYDPRLYPDLYCRTCKDALYGWERDVCDKCRIRELQALVSELQGLVKQCIANAQEVRRQQSGGLQVNREINGRA